MKASSIFVLLRLALGTQRAEDAATLAGLPISEWAALLELASQQNVMAIAYDGLEQLVDNIPVSDIAAKQADAVAWTDFVVSWGGNVFFMEQRYAHYQATIASLVKFLCEHSIRMMLLKGYGLSLNYPIPTHRPCGDIDIFCYADGFLVDKLVSEELGIKVKDGDSHHSKFNYKGWSVENHHSFMEQDSYRSNRSFEKELLQWIEEGREAIMVNDVAFDIPAPSLMALHLTRHAGCDFASNTISLRQLLDWALFVDKRSAEVDWDRVTNIIDSMGMRGFLDLMNDLSVNVLGLSKDKFPPFKENGKLRCRAINDILFAPRVNEFPDYRKKLVYGLAKTRQAWHNRWKNRLVFNESFLSLYWQKATNRLKHS